MPSLIVTGDNVRLEGGKLIVDNDEYTGFEHILELRIIGEIGFLHSDANVICGAVGGSVIAGGDVYCTEANGPIHAGGEVEAQNRPSRFEKPHLRVVHSR